ncbi:MAG: hypothetical protein U1C19_10800 [Methanobacteriaceae archaeon]|nr:hypothetical protein [Methanobacteriaceae archaeon]
MSEYNSKDLIKLEELGYTDLWNTDQRTIQIDLLGIIMMELGSIRLCLCFPHTFLLF